MVVGGGAVPMVVGDGEVGGAVDGTVVVGGVLETHHIVVVVGVLGILDLVQEQLLVLEEHLVVNYTKRHPL